MGVLLVPFVLVGIILLMLLVVFVSKYQSSP